MKESPQKQDEESQVQSFQQSNDEQINTSDAELARIYSSDGEFSEEYIPRKNVNLIISELTGYISELELRIKTDQNQPVVVTQGLFAQPKVITTEYRVSALKKAIQVLQGNNPDLTDEESKVWEKNKRFKSILGNQYAFLIQHLELPEGFSLFPQGK